MQLNNEQKSIIEHTIKNGIFCGGSEDMNKLVDAGLIKYAGRKSFVPDPYYRVTPAGKQALNEVGRDEKTG